MRLLSDTVGFIRKLPTNIISAFRATLEELEEADLLLNVIDFSSPYAAEENHAVENILKDLELLEKPRITVLNKIDLALGKDKNLDRRRSPGIFIEQPNGNSEKTCFLFPRSKNGV